MTNRWVMSRKNFFTHDCLKEIKTIHITVYYMRFNYLPMASAILRKVNTNRRKEKQEPLEIIFYTRWGYHNDLKPYDHVKPYGRHLNFWEFTWYDHPLIKAQKDSDNMEKIKNKSNVYIRIFTGELNEYDYRVKPIREVLIKAQDYYYRALLLRKKDECFNDVSAKTFRVF